MNYSNVFTASPNIPERAWALPFAGGLWSGPAVESGWSPSPAGVRHFTLQSHSKTSSEAASGQNANLILLVEDNPADANLVRKALEEHNIEGELMVAGDGENAIRLIEELDALSVDCPDLIIVDLSLPKRSGREVLARLRLSARCSRVPIVILTSSDAKKDQVEAARLGVSQYLRKPSRLEDFLNLGGILKAILAGSAR